jgi:hypothetical protein
MNMQPRYSIAEVCAVHEKFVDCRVVRLRELCVDAYQ